LTWSSPLDLAPGHGYPQPEWVMAARTTRFAGRTLAARQSGKDFDVEDLAAGFIRFKKRRHTRARSLMGREYRRSRTDGDAAAWAPAGLLQRNVNEGYAFSADIYLERNGAPFGHAYAHTGHAARSPCFTTPTRS